MISDDGKDIFVEDKGNYRIRAISLDNYKKILYINNCPFLFFFPKNSEFVPVSLPGIHFYSI